MDDMTETWSLPQLLPFAKSKLEEVYRTAETPSGRLVPSVPAIGIVVRGMFETAGQVPAGATDKDFHDPASAERADTVLQQHMDSALPGDKPTAYLLLNGLGESIMAGLVLDRAHQHGVRPNMRTGTPLPVAEAFFNRVMGSGRDPYDAAIDYVSQQTGVDARRIAEGYTERIARTYGVKDRSLQDENNRSEVKNMIGLGMLQGYWEAGGE